MTHTMIMSNTSCSLTLTQLRSNIIAVTEDRRDLVDWFKKIGKAFTRKTRRELEEDQQQSIDGSQESFAGRDLRPSFKPGPKIASKYRKMIIILWSDLIFNLL